MSWADVPMMRIAVCIVGFRNPADVIRAVAALSASDYPPARVVICENGGAAAAAALTEVLPPALETGGAVRVIDAGGNLGYAGGFNRCVAETNDADGWWLLNPDARPEPAALGAMIARLCVGDCDAVGGVLLQSDGRVQSYGGIFRKWAARCISIGRDTAFDPSAVPLIENRIDYISGASMLVTRAFREAAGPMREDYFLYAEEVEWCLRAKARGLRLGFAPEAVIHHDQGSTTGSAAAITRRRRLPVHLDERNRLHVMRDCFPRDFARASVGALLQILLRYARRGAWRQTGYALGGWWAGIRGERGIPDFVVQAPPSGA